MAFEHAALCALGNGEHELAWISSHRLGKSEISSGRVREGDHEETRPAGSGLKNSLTSLTRLVDLAAHLTADVEDDSNETGGRKASSLYKFLYLPPAGSFFPQGWQKFSRRTRPVKRSVQGIG